MKNILRPVFVVFSIVLFSISAIAQQSVAPPPRPANDAPANAAVLKLLQVGMPESVVLEKIRTITDKFDTSIDALVTLKQAGATEAELKAILARDSAPAEQPLAAAPADTGPSLAETMQFIQEKLNDIGEVSLVEFAQDLNDDSTGTGTAKYKFSNVFADQYQCRISYHWNHIQDGRIGQNENNVFSLRDVQDIVIKPLEQYLNEYDAKNGRPSIILTSTSPPISVLQIRRPHGEDNIFTFTDADLADRVAKAMLHAVELCGGGNKEKF
jgi:hypothetical protein